MHLRNHFEAAALVCATVEQLRVSAYWQLPKKDPSCFHGADTINVKHFKPEADRRNKVSVRRTITLNGIYNDL